MIKSEYDVLSNDYKEIELSDKEIDKRNAKEKAINTAKEKAIKVEADKALAKASALTKLTALGLTEEEAASILG